MLRNPLFTLLCVAFSSASFAEAEWTPGGRGEGPGFTYQVFYTQVPDESFVRYEARGRVDAPPELLSAAVRTITSDPARAPKGQTRRILQADDEAFVVHTRIDLPALFSDRDIVTRGVRRAEGEGLRIDWQATEHPAAPPSEGVIRIQKSAGFWSFAPAADGTTEVVYASFVDVAGSLPGWLIDPLTEETVARVFEDVAQEALTDWPGAVALP